MPPRHVYVHVPFCARRCVYCDFSIAVRRDVPVGAFVAGIGSELQIRDERSPAADTLYFGGGTPSRLGGDGVVRLIAVLSDRVTLAEGAEVTLEANPEDVTPSAARSWAGAGVNRVSLGVQSFDATVLAWMHRGHDAGSVARAVDTLREAGIRNLSVDLIYALPPSVQRDWRRDLDQALQLEPDHLSCYGLTVEPRTPLGRWVARDAMVPAEDVAHEREFLEAHTTLAAAGFEHYEVSNYARPGRRSRHNSAYWTGVPYLALGPAAHGFDGTERRWNLGPYAAWLQAVQRGRDPVEGREVLSAADRGLEEVYLGLRTTAGLVTRGADAPMIERWQGEGWVTSHGDRVRPTPLGWLRLDALVAALTDHRSRY